MSLLTLGLSAELAGRGVGVCSLWPYTLVGTSAMNLVSRDPPRERRTWRHPAFVAEAAWRILTESPEQVNGRSFVDEIYLRRQHAWSDQRIRTFSLGGEDVPLDQLALDLWISKDLQEDVARARRGE